MSHVRCFPRLALVALLTVASGMTAKAALINATVITDTPLLWEGYVDWAQPVTGSVQTIGLSSNWAVGVVEIPTGGGNGVLVVTARHLVEPHAPPMPMGLFVAAAFGPMMPGGAAVPVVDWQPHMDDPGHLDNLRVHLTALNATTSRVNIQIAHGEVPEPSTLALAGLGLVSLGLWRRKRR